LSFSGTGSFSIDNDLNISDDFSIDASTFSAGSNSMYVGGDWTNAGTFNANTSTVDFNGGGTSTLDAGGDAFNDLEITNSTTIDLAGNDLEVSGSFNNEGTLKVVGGELLTITGDTDSGTVNYYGGGTYTGIAAGLNEYYDVTFTGSGSFTTAGNINIYNDFNISAGIFTSDPNSYSFDVGNSFSITREGGVFDRFADGDGSGGSPYQIEDVYALQAMWQNSTYRDKSYILNNDIDASGTQNWNDGDGFIPVGGSYDGFGGTFNGANNTISDLYINDTGSNLNLGLFGYVDNGNVSNVGLINPNVTGTEQMVIDSPP